MTTPPDPERGIAVIGMACRVPAAHGVDEFWQLLMDGADAVSAAPPDRPDGAARPRGGFLDDIDGFDADFFGITPLEAEAMDPQLRLLLECTADALADAGQDAARLAGSRTGVFVGTDASPYWDLLSRREPTIYGVLGGAARSAMAGRIAFTFDLTGPALVVDTACSSSLMALAAAVHSLRAGESRMAVVAGAHIVLANAETEAFTTAGMLAADGRCKFGDAAADGFVRSEAVATVVLKPLAAAVADGDPVRAVIRGVGTSNDGRGDGLFMAPAVRGQTAMLAAAYADAGIDPAEVDVVEAHGTGTQAGDPVELEALAVVLGPGRDPGRRLLVGSHKTNIGHSEGAAGLVGLIKAVLCLQHRAVPANLHLNTPNPEIAWSQLPLSLPRSPQPLDEDRPLAAGVSAFGITGTNVHVVLTSPDTAAGPGPRTVDAALAEGADEGAAHLLTLSARSGEALHDLVRSHLAHLGPHGDGRRQPVREICRTAATRRTHHEHRLAVVHADHDGLAEHLRSALHGVRTAPPAQPTRIAFVFPGQGSQWVGMGRELLACSPAFRAALAECDAAARAHTGWSVIERLASGTEPLRGVALVQPVLWAMEVALARTWQAWGVEPGLVIGHSMGEVAAACVSGALSLDDGAGVICRRSALMARSGGRGAMLVVGLPAAEAGELAAQQPDRVSVAVSNSSASTVLSGDPDALAAIGNRLDAAGVFCQPVNVDIASHSPQMDPLLDALAASLSGIEPRDGQVEMLSTVTAAPIRGSALDARYWSRNLREPVQFHPAVAAAAAQPTVFVEISPHPLLTGAVEQTLTELGAAGAAVGSLRRDQLERATMLTALATLYEQAAPVALQRLYPTGPTVALPRYPWQHRRYWHGPPPTADTAAQSHRHDFVLDTAAEPHLLGHVVNGVHLVAGTVLLDMARTAGLVERDGPVDLVDVHLTAALVLTPGERRVVHVDVVADGPTARFTVSSTDLPGEQPVEHVHGTITDAADAVDAVDAIAPDRSPSAAAARLGEQWPAHRFYAWAEEGGCRWADSYRAVTALWRGPDEVVARVELPSGLSEDADARTPHPALLEACTAPLLAAFEHPTWIVGQHIAAVRIRRAARTGWTHVRLTSPREGATVTADVVVLDDQEQIVAEMTGLQVRPARPTETGAEPVTEPDPAEPDALTVEVCGQLRVTDAHQRPVLALSGSFVMHTPGSAGPVGAGAVGAVSAPAQIPVPRATASAASAVAPSAPLAAVTSAAPSAPTPALPTPARPAAAPSAPTPALPTPARPAAPGPAAPEPVGPVVPVDAPPAGTRGTGAGQRGVAQADPAAEPVDTDAVLERLVGHLAEISRRPAARIDVRSSAPEQGVDSLMALEVKARLQRQYQVAVPAKLLLRAPSLRAAAEQIAELVAVGPA